MLVPSVLKTWSWSLQTSQWIDATDRDIPVPPLCAAAARVTRCERRRVYKKSYFFYTLCERRTCAGVTTAEDLNPHADPFELHRTTNLK